MKLQHVEMCTMLLTHTQSQKQHAPLMREDFTESTFAVREIEQRGLSAPADLIAGR